MKNTNFTPIDRPDQNYRQVKKVWRGNYSAIMEDNIGQIWACGNNTSGMLCFGNPEKGLFDASVPTKSYPQIMQVFQWFGKKPIDIAHGYRTYVFLDSSSYAWSFGYNEYGVLGNPNLNDSTSTLSPVSVAVNFRWKKIVNSKYYSQPSFGGINEQSYAWCWGNDSVGQLGNNALVHCSSPVSVVGGRQFKDIALAYNTGCCLDSNGYAWTWGASGGGLLGNNDSINDRSSPVSVWGGRQFTKVYGGIYHFVALDQSSYAWAWGNNAYGQLGVYTDSNGRSSPVSVVGGRQWKDISCYNYTTYGLDSNSYMWAWGNNYGNCGDGEVWNKSSPVSVLGGKQWISFYGNHAIDNLSYLWAWGEGPLGDGTGPASAQYSPVQLWIKKPVANIFGKRK